MIKRTLVKSIQKMGLYKYWVAFREDYYPTADMQRMRIFYAQFVKPDSVCFDIGANMGSRIAAFRALKAHVVAVEPQKLCVQFLKQRFGKEVKIVAKGVGSQLGWLNFYVSDESLLSSFSTEWIANIKQKFAHHNWEQVEQVEMTTLDALIAEYGVPDFVKIDVEGYELEVLQGLSQGVKALSFEYAYAEQKQKVLDCLRVLHRLMPNATYNYSPGETFEFKLSPWCSYENLLQHFESPDFAKKTMGDIYVLNGA
ncbi:MAG: FkbM family methyltransferase [Runella slithyformis]|nr:MAG: FkbM family methyltransferase [Runella slithyformis]TAF27697.1 MAG: FkbM family methyltransferase [Runella slithyformis]TAF44625.1 MAG: FkbM family methyltransferase [Runella slithyformis]TAF80171.1 MAG: FkbM family methyltransferase [Runella slithyformis]